MKEGRNLTPVVDDVSVTSIVMAARSGSPGTAVGTMVVRIKLFSLLQSSPSILVTLLCSLFSLDTRTESKMKHDEKAKVEAESSGCVSSL